MARLVATAWWTTVLAALLGGCGSGTFTPTGSMGLTRGFPSATLLPNGKVLIAGGRQLATAGRSLDSAELFDPAGNGGVGTFSATGSPLGALGARATLLPTGKVLFQGDVDGAWELYDPAGNGGAGSFSATASLVTGRRSPTATLLPNGKVLIAGGQDLEGLGGTRSAELYDPAGNGGAGSFTATASLVTGRFGMTATLLSSGKVLIVGGRDADSALLSSAELYDPTGNGGAGSFTATASLVTGRYGPTATLLPTGKVLIAGGVSADAALLASAELYDPTGNGGAGSFTATASLVTGRYLMTATLLTSGKVLIAGGYSYGPCDSDGGCVGPSYLASAELYDPAGNSGAGSFTATGNLMTARRSAAATALANGKVLIAGGFNIDGWALDSAELYDP